VREPTYAAAIALPALRASEARKTSVKPRNIAANPTQSRMSAARGAKNCCEAQNASRSLRRP
jgi:hypothetical protein